MFITLADSGCKCGVLKKLGGVKRGGGMRAEMSWRYGMDGSKDNELISAG